MKFRLQQLAIPSRLTAVLVSLLLATPALIFWLWLVIEPARVAVLCPEECQCDLGGYRVTCDNTSLTAVPFIPFTGVRHLWLTQNKIKVLERDIFFSRELTDLSILNIQRCGLSKIDLEAFSGLTKLRFLFIHANDLSEIIPGTFGNMSNLEHLDLEYNRVKHLRSDMFSGLINLKYIYLTNNELQSINPDTFLGLPNLQRLLLGNNRGLQIPIDRNFIKSHSLLHLDISGCNVHSVSVETFANVSALEQLVLQYNMLEYLDSDVFSGLVNLKRIYLTSNKLQYLHPDTFLGLPNLQRLYLSYNPALQIPTDRNFINSQSLSYLGMISCNVSSVSFETFANVSALEQLDLKYNYLTTVDIKILSALPNLSSLYLEENPLHCDCHLQEVWRWCQHRNIRTAYRSNVLKCDTPSEVKGIWWGVLEKGHCVEGNIQYYGDYKNTNYSYSDTENSYWDEYDVDFLTHNEVPVYIFPFIFGTTGNIILLIIIICNKDMRTVPNMYILNLATSDIIYLTILFSEACAKRTSGTWLEGDFMCMFIPFCRRLSVGLSAYSVAVLSIQRYRVTVTPLQIHVTSQPTWRDIVAIIFGVWIVAALFAIPSALSQHLCNGPERLKLLTYYQHVVIFELLVSCVLPLCVIAFTYIMTALHLVESSRSVSEGTQNPQLNTRRNTAKIVVGLTVVFLISYVPNHVQWTYAVCTIEEDIYLPIRAKTLLSSHYKLQYPYLISTCFLFLNSCLNPVALFCTSSPFRQHLKRYLTCCCKTNSPPAALELTRRN